MADTAEVVLSHPWRDDKGTVHETGTRLSVATDVAKRLTRAGNALPATKPDAEAAGVSPETAKTARK